MRAVWPHHVQVAAEATETWAAELHGLLAVGLEQDPLAIGPLLGKPIGSRGRPARQAGLVLAVRPSAVDLLDPGRIELGGEHLAVPGPGRILAEPAGQLVHDEAPREIGARYGSTGCGLARPERQGDGERHCRDRRGRFPYLMLDEQKSGVAGPREAGGPHGPRHACASVAREGFPTRSSREAGLAPGRVL